MKRPDLDFDTASYVRHLWELRPETLDEKPSRVLTPEELAAGDVCEERR